MPQDLKASVVRILKPDGSAAGAGFLVDNRLAVTCAHVVKAAGSAPGSSIEVEFLQGNQKLTARVLSDRWSNVNADDVAFLQLELLPVWTKPVILGTAQGRSRHDFSHLAFLCLSHTKRVLPRGDSLG